MMLPIARVPTATVSPPVKLLGPDKVKVPVPVLTTFPLAELSEITPLKVRFVRPLSIWKVAVSPDVMTKGMVLDIDAPVYSSVPSRVTELLCPSVPLVLILLMVAIANVPADTVKPPLKLFVPDKVKIPEPSMVNELAPVAIASEIVVLPMPPTVRPYPPLIPPVESVKSPASELIRVLLPNVIVPLKVLLPLIFLKAPSVEMPVPFNVKALLTLMPPCACKAAPAETLAEPVPSADEFWIFKTPLVTVVVPE